MGSLTKKRSTARRKPPARKKTRARKNGILYFDNVRTATAAQKKLWSLGFKQVGRGKNLARTSGPQYEVYSQHHSAGEMESALTGSSNPKRRKHKSNPYEVFDTQTGQKIAQYPSEQAARRDQKLFNAGSPHATAGPGYVVRYAVRKVKKNSAKKRAAPKKPRKLKTPAGEQFVLLNPAKKRATKKKTAKKRPKKKAAPRKNPESDYHGYTLEGGGHRLYLDSMADVRAFAKTVDPSHSLYIRKGRLQDRQISRLYRKAKPKKRNPETAEQMYEDFHGEPPARVRDVEVTDEHPTEVADLGKLLAFEIFIDGDRKPTPFEAKGNTRVWTTPEGGQLYFHGGDQAIDLAAIGLEYVLPKDHVEIGPVNKIWYHTRKGFHDFEPIDYHHKFGEAGGVMPTLHYDTRNKRVYLTGGTYQVRPEGIVN